MKHLLILIIVINNSCSCQSSLNNFEFKLYKLLVADTLSNSLFKEIQIESKNLYFRKICLKFLSKLQMILLLKLIKLIPLILSVLLTLLIILIMHCYL